MKKAESTEPIARIHVDRERCKGCGFCVEFCDSLVLEMSSEHNAKGYRLLAVKGIEDCNLCQMCQRVCPEFAIFTKKIGKKKGPDA